MVTPAWALCGIFAMAGPSAGNIGIEYFAFKLKIDHLWGNLEEPRYFPF